MDQCGDFLYTILWQDSLLKTFSSFPKKILHYFLLETSWLYQMKIFSIILDAKEVIFAVYFFRKYCE